MSRYIIQWAVYTSLIDAVNMLKALKFNVTMRLLNSQVVECSALKVIYMGITMGSNPRTYFSIYLNEKQETNRAKDWNLEETKKA